MKDVVIYSTPTCHFCHAAKDFFIENNIGYIDHNVSDDLAARQQMVAKSGQMGVPVIEIGDEIVVGFDEELLREKLGL